MKINIALFILIFIILTSCKQEKLNSIDLRKSISIVVQHTDKTISTNYKGEIGKNLDVLFHLKNDNGKITGFYFYKKTGIDIRIIGNVVKNKFLAYELNYKKDTTATLIANINESSINGKWINAKTKKEYPLRLIKTPNKTNPLPTNIVGVYYNKICNLTLSISISKGEYYYNYSSDERKLNGKITFSREEDLYLTLEGIEFAEDYFDISLPEENEEKQKEFDRLKKLGERYVGIDCYYSPEELIIQNYGNAMSYYVKLSDCGEKYIHFIKK